MDTQMGAVDTTFVIAGDSPVSGKATLGTFEGAIEGKRDGDKVSFSVTIEHGTVKFEGTVAADEMTLAVTGTRGDKMNLVVKRQK
jgi:hypothetical protein